MPAGLSLFIDITRRVQYKRRIEFTPGTEKPCTEAHMHACNGSLKTIAVIQVKK